MSTDQETKTAQPGALALLLGRDQRRSVIRLESSAAFRTHRRTIAREDLIGVPWGTEIETHLGAPLILLRPSTDDLLRNLECTTQIVSATDAGYIRMKVDSAPDRRVIEAGTISGGLTLVCARAVHPEGHVISYDCRADVQEGARKNLTRMNLAPCPTLKQRNISARFDERSVDALFLGVPNPRVFVEPAYAALAGGGSLDPSCRPPTR